MTPTHALPAAALALTTPAPPRACAQTRASGPWEQHGAMKSRAQAWPRPIGMETSVPRRSTDGRDLRPMTMPAK